jgi:hypothetical protein
MTKTMRVVAVMMMACSESARAQPPAAPVEAASTVPADRQEIKGEVQLRGALLRANDELFAKDEEIAQLKYFLAKLQRAVNDRDKAKLEPDLLKSFGAPTGSIFDWRNFRVVPPPTPQPPTPPTGVKIDTSKGKPTP